LASGCAGSFGGAHCPDSGINPADRNQGEKQHCQSHDGLTSPGSKKLHAGKPFVAI
jgi:hypothetical protein